jgi:rRNA maturation RNase YbeY
MAGSVSIRNFTRRAAPRASFDAIAAAVLPGWDISLVFAGPARAKALNQKLRKKSYVPNVLSYESGVKSGEIIICLEVAKKQARSYEMTYADFVPYLFIHGCLHLKGHPHGTTMDRRERELLARYVRVHTFNETKNRDRH